MKTDANGAAAPAPKKTSPRWLKIVMWLAVSELAITVLMMVKEIFEARGMLKYLL